jgi:hypothetical protein
MLWHCNFFYQFTFIIYMKKKKKHSQDSHGKLRDYRATMEYGPFCLPPSSWETAIYHHHMHLRSTIYYPQWCPIKRHCTCHCPGHCSVECFLFCFVLFCFLFKLRWMIIKADRATYIPSFNFQQDHTYQAKDFFFARFRQLLSMTDYMITLIPPSNVAVAPFCFSLGANRGL